MNGICGEDFEMLAAGEASDAAKIAALTAQRDVLLAALERTLAFCYALERYHGQGTGTRRGAPVFEAARAAIAQAKKENIYADTEAAIAAAKGEA